jgi:hypothetical protein
LGAYFIVRQISVIVALMLFCTAVSAQDESGIIYGKNYSFALTAPKGWVLDTTSGRQQGLQAVFYPKGSSWKNGAAVMYANVYQNTDPTKESLQTIIANDVADFKKESPNLKVVDADAIPTRTDVRSIDKKATVKYFTGDRNGNSEAVAYVDEGNLVVMLVFNARSQKDFEDSLPAFKEFVGSYFFLGAAVVH